MILASCSIIYELLIAHTIGLMAYNLVIWFCLTIGIYLLFLGFGSLLYRKIFPSKTNWDALLTVELVLSISGVLVVIIMHSAHMIFDFLYARSFMVLCRVCFFSICFLCAAIIGFFSGMELPLLINAGNSLKGTRITNRVLAMDYIGSIIGAVVFALFLVPNFGVVQTGFYIGTINLIIAALILIIFLHGNKNFFGMIFIIIFLFIGFIYLMVNTKNIEQYFLKKYYYSTENMEKNLFSYFFNKKKLPNVESYQSYYQRIDIYKDPVFDIHDLLMRAYSPKLNELEKFPDNYYLYMNCDVQFYSTDEEFYHEYFAHIPIITLKFVPSRVLVLGAGDGMLIRELLKYKQIREIVHIELDQKMIDLANNHKVVNYLNQDSLKNPRVKVLVADAFKYLRQQKQKFDAIYIDFPYATNYDLSKLYSKEFYQYLKKRITSRGFAAIDAPGSANFTEFDEKGEQQFNYLASDWLFYYNTLKAAGFNSIIPYAVNLELDNPDTFELLDDHITVIDEKNKKNIEKERSKSGRKKAKLVLGKHQKKKDVFQGFINGCVLAHQQGFIMLRTNPEKIMLEYKQPEIKTYTINRQRFYRCFDLPYVTTNTIDKTKINSIMRPTLPYVPFWYVRTRN